MDIAIWGTGNVAKYITKLLKKNNSYFIKYYVDSDSLQWDQEINGIAVISPDKLQECFSDELDFVLVSFLGAHAIYDRLIDMKIGRFGLVQDKIFMEKLYLEEDLFQDRNILWYGASDRPVLRYLETNIVDDCNLNCRGCSHFSNLFEKDSKVPFETFCMDLQQVSKHVQVMNLNLLGGEPLLNDEIIDYIKFARKIFPDSQIQMTTNGLLIPKQTKDFFQCCSENHIVMIITVYKPTLFLKDKITDLLEKYQILYSLRWTKEKFGKNIDLTGTADQYTAVNRCRENRCCFLRDGKIYKCPFEALGNIFFKYYQLPVRFQGGVDIYNENLDWDVLLNDLYYNPVDACRYCGEEEKMEWKATNSPLMEDWVVREH